MEVAIRSEVMGKEFNQIMEHKIQPTKKRFLTLPEAVEKIVRLQEEILGLKQEIARLKAR